MHIHTSWAQNIPYVEKLISPLRLLSPFLFRFFDLSQYDVVIVSATGAYFPNSVRRNHKQLLFCYCHTPPRYLYGYETAREWRKDPIMNILGTIANHILRIVDFYASRNVDFFIANSQEVASRIKKFYRRESTVIYPPVDINVKRKTKNEKQEDKTQNSYYLAGGRLARPKHIDLIVRACREQNIPLKVFGRGFAGYEDEIQNSSADWRIKIQNSNTEFLGEVREEEKYELMRNAKAYVFASTDEDFGITPVEAMSVGCPVIAYRGGGVLETVIEGKTGLFFDELTEESLLKAIKRFDDSNHRSMF